MASQARGVRARTGLCPDRTDAAAWTVATNGDLDGVADGDLDGVAVGGARAIALAVAVAWQRRFPLWPWRIPGVPWLLDRLYALVARFRHRLPGTTPWCAAHPGECGDEPGADGGSAEP